MHVVAIGNTLYLVVAGDGNVDMSEGGVCVAESNHRDVHIGSLSHRLVVNAWVSHNQQAWLTVGSLNMEEKKKAGPTQIFHFQIHQNHSLLLMLAPSKNERGS